MLSRRTRGVVTAAAAVAVAAGVAIAATLADGRIASHADTNDGGAWLLNRDAGAVGHVNRTAQELTGAVRVAEPRTLFDVDQARGVVLVHDRSGAIASLVDDRTYTPSGSIEASEAYELHAVVGGIVATTADPATLRRFRLDDLPEFESVEDVPPLVESEHAGRAFVDLEDRAVLVTNDGMVFVAEPDSDPTTVEAGPWSSPPVAATSVGGPVLITTEDGEVVVVADRNRTLPIDGTWRPGDWTWQQPSPSAPTAVAVTPDGEVLSVDLASGRVEQDFELDGGLPVDPIVHGGCVFAVSSQPATFARKCGEDLYTTALTGRDGRAPSQLRLRLVNGWVWLNDVDTGTIWVADIEGELSQIDDWGVALAEDDGSDEEETNTDGPADRQRENPDDAERFVQADQIIDDGPNEPPVARDDTAATRQERPVVVDVLANDTDPNGDVLMVSAVEHRAEGDAIVTVTSDRRAVQVDPAAGFTGTVRFVYEVSDGRGGTDTANVTVDVTPMDPERNRPPQPVTDIVTVRAGETATINVLTNDTDPDGDSLVLRGVHGEGADTTWAPDGTVTITPHPDQEGRLEYTYTVADEWGLEAEGRIRIDVRLADSNQPPDARHDAAQTVVGRPIVIDVLANDTDPDGDQLIVQGRPELVQAPAGEPPFFTLDPRGEFYFEASVAGTYVFRYTVSDGSLSDSALIRIEVAEADENRPPIATRDDITIPAGASRIVPVLHNDRDPDGDVLSIVDWTQPDGLRVEAFGGDALRVTALPDSAGVITFRYFISDGVNDPVSSIVAVMVVPDAVADLPPVAVADRFDVRAGQLTTLPVLANDYDPEGGALRIVGVTDPAEAATAVTADGLRVRVDVPQSTTGSFTFGYTIEDEGDNQDSATVSIRVVPESEPNRAPVAGTDIARTLQGQPVVIDVLANDRDPDGDPIRVAGIARQPANGHALLLEDGRVEYRPDRRFTGTDRFAYTVVDARGLQAVGEVLVGVTPPWHENRPPQARDDVAMVRAGSGPTAIDVLANDRDPDGDPLTVVAVGDVSLGRTGIATEGRGVVFEPPATIPEAQVEVAFRYTVDDGRGGRADATVTVTVTRDGLDQPPIAIDDVVGPVTPGEPLLIDVLANDRNPGGSVDDLRLTVTDPALQVTDRQVRLTAPETTRSYLYTITDPATGLSADAALTVLVVANRPPLVAPLEVETEFNQPIRVVVTDQAVDPDGDELFFSCCDAQRGGRATVVSTSPTELVVTFEPSSDHTGPAGFAYLVDDRQGHQVAGSVAIEVLPPDNRPPVARDGSLEVEAGSSRSLDLSTLVDDEDDDDTHTFRIDAPGGGLRAEVRGSLLTVEAGADTTGTSARIAYTVSDAAGASDDAVIEVEVVPTSQPLPEARPDTARTVDGEPVVVRVLDNDLGDGLRVVAAAGSSDARAEVADSGSTVRVTPNAGFSGTTTVTYTIRDSFDTPDREVTGRIELTVIGTPSPPGAPTVDVESEQATLTWSAATNNGAPIEGYEIEHDNGGSRSVGAMTTTTWSGLNNGTTYRFRVRAQNEAGWGDFSPWSVAVTPNAVPGRPSPPRVRFGDARLEVTWLRPDNPGSAITSYLLEIGGAASSVREVAAGGAQQSITWDGLTNGANYTFRVKAINAADPSGGEWSDWSEPENPLTRPSAPSRPTLDNGPNYLDVSWSLPADGGDPIQEYEVEIDTGRTIRVSGGSTSTYRWADLPNGTDHRFRVRAWNRDSRGGQWSPWSEVGRACDVPTAPSAPSGSRGDRQASITWSAPDARGCNITSYDITVDDGGTVRSVGGSTTSFQWDGLTNGQDYRFRVRAVNEMGNGEWSSPSPAIRPAGPPLQTTVSAVDATAVRQLRVRWAAANDNGRPIQRYELSVNGGSPQAVGTGTEHTLTGLSGGTDYSVRVRAVNEIGAGPWSAAVSRAAQDVPAKTPRPSVTQTTTSSIRWSWDAASARGSSITRYEIDRSNGASTVNNGTSRTYTWTGLSASTSRTIRVRACNTWGCGEWSDSRQGTTQAPAPTVVIAKGGNAQGATGGFEGGGCTRETCRWIEITAQNFAPNSSLTIQFQDRGPATGCDYSSFTTYGATTHSTNSSGAFTSTRTYFFAYPGCQVRIIAGGVTSNTLQW